ncbi:hypothetical protein DEM27_31245 [Metarhizobium album]|uniref:Uncharacterized protein n=1 Tax=Metarhizobium album TaxID=2182425 RepID=A0A2U2DGM5_9HYPH|nr:hypothetical protein [Rhizobium album]PWE52424.1 hypothetical protein DEM27_31245 [Rhizobium album]
MRTTPLAHLPDRLVLPRRLVPRRRPISELIDLHRQAVLADDAMFDEDGNVLDEKGAGDTLAEEHKRFKKLVGARCQTEDEVQAKLAYIVHGTVGERDALIDTVVECGLLESLLQSLILRAEACQ